MNVVHSSNWDSLKVSLDLYISQYHVQEWESGLALFQNIIYWPDIYINFWKNTVKTLYYSNQSVQIDVLGIVIHLIYDPWVWRSWNGFLAYSKSWIKPWTSVGLNIIDEFFLWKPIILFNETFTCKKLVVILTVFPSKWFFSFYQLGYIHPIWKATLQLIYRD